MQVASVHHEYGRLTLVTAGLLCVTDIENAKNFSSRVDSHGGRDLCMPDNSLCCKTRYQSRGLWKITKLHLAM